MFTIDRFVGCSAARAARQAQQQCHIRFADRHGATCRTRADAARIDLPARQLSTPCTTARARRISREQIDERRRACFTGDRRRIATRRVCSAAGSRGSRRKWQAQAPRLAACAANGAASSEQTATSSAASAKKTRDGRGDGALACSRRGVAKSVVNRILSEFDDLVVLHRRGHARCRSVGDAM
jgi:hypothetical protein